MGPSVVLLAFLGTSLIFTNSVHCSCNYLKLISESLMHALEIIVAEHPKTSTTDVHEILREGHSGACFGLDGGDSVEILNISRLLRHLDGGDEQWQKIFFSSVQNISDVTRVVQEVSGGNQHWIYLIVFPSVDAESSAKKFQLEIDSSRHEDFADGLSIASKVFVLFPQNLNSPGSNTNVKLMENLCMPYPLHAVSMYTLKKRFFLQHVIFYNSINLENIFDVHDLREDFQSTIIKAVAVHKPGAWEQAISSEEGEDGVVRFTDGFETEAITYIAQALNFSLEAGITDVFVGRNESGNLTGMGKIVLDDAADISISASELLDWRKEHLTFLQPTFLSRVQGFMLPPPRSATGNVIFLAFQLKTWEAYIGTVFGLALCVTCCLKLKKLLTGCSDHGSHDYIIENEALLWATGAACQQGWHINPDSVWLRIIFISGYVLGLVCFIGYSATLVSMISNEQQPLKSLTEWHKLGWNLLPDQSTKALQTLEEDNGLKFMWNVPNDLAMKRMLSGGNIFLSSNEIFNPIVRNYFREYNIRACGKGNDYMLDGDGAICLLVYGFPIDLPVVKAAMFLKKQSPLAGLFQKKYVQLSFQYIVNIVNPAAIYWPVNLPSIRIIFLNGTLSKLTAALMALFHSDQNTQASVIYTPNPMATFVSRENKWTTRRILHAALFHHLRAFCVTNSCVASF